MDSPRSPVIVGIHLAAGTGWLAVATDDEMLVHDEADRIVLEDSELDPPRALFEFEETVESLVNRLSPIGVGLLDAGTSQTPSAKDSRRRGWLEAAVMLAAHRRSSELLRVSHHQVQAAFGVRPTRPELRKLLDDNVGGQPPPVWNQRAPALAAAIVARRRISDRA